MKNKKIFIILPHLGGGGAEKSTLYLVNDWIKKNYVIYIKKLKFSCHFLRNTVFP